jgi:hypothetical protein
VFEVTMREEGEALAEFRSGWSRCLFACLFG